MAVISLALAASGRPADEILDDFSQAIGGTPQKTAMIFGIFAMVGLMHNAVHALPGVFSGLFSPDWTEEIIASSEPGTLYFRGNYFVLIEGGEEVAAAEEGQGEAGEKALPRIIRLQ